MAPRLGHSASVILVHFPDGSCFFSFSLSLCHEHNVVHSLVSESLLLFVRSSLPCCFPIYPHRTVPTPAIYNDLSCFHQSPPGVCLLFASRLLASGAWLYALESTHFAVARLICRPTTTPIPRWSCLTPISALAIYKLENTGVLSFVVNAVKH